MSISKAKKIVNKIYFIRANKNKFGGAEVYLSRLSLALNKKKIDHKIVHSIFPNFLPSWLKVILFNLQLLTLKGNSFYFSLDRILYPDIYRAGDGVHKIFLKVEKKSIFNPLHPIYLFLERRCFSNAKCIIVNSVLVKKQIIETYKINPSKIKLVRNGIKLKKVNYDDSYEKLSTEFLLKSNQKYILYVGSGYKRKGVEEFLEIISRLNSQEIKAFIIGKDKKLEHYKRFAKNLGIEHKVIFTGPREDVDDFYSISDIFLFPTHYEPFANVILEAMLFKNVIFTTKQNGACEILDNQFIMENPSDFSVVNKIDELLNNTKKLREIQKNNRTQAKEFSIEKNLEHTLEIIDEVIN